MLIINKTYFYKFLKVSIFNNVDELEKLVHQQKDALDQEEKERDLYRKFGL